MKNKKIVKKLWWAECAMYLQWRKANLPMVLRPTLFPALILLFLSVKPASAEMVIASFYTKESAQREGTSGIFTASGERFNEGAQTCAHPTKPFGTLLKVKNPKNGIWYECRVNDRGPARWTGNGIDLTPKGWRLLKLKPEQGIAKVEVL